VNFTARSSAGKYFQGLLLRGDLTKLHQIWRRYRAIIGVPNHLLWCRYVASFRLDGGL